LLAQWVTTQLVFNGLINGLLTGLLAMSMVLVYRSTRVINFAVGSIGLIGATLLPLLVLDYGFPYWVGLAACLVCGTLFASVVELIVLRRLFEAPRLIVLVATVGSPGCWSGSACSPTARTRWPARCRVASSRCSRSPSRCSTTPTCC
jgi:branched-subunit amino acid ABC-type transport system permease component